MLEQSCKHFATHVYVNPQKTHLFCTEIEFLGHHISTQGIEADSKKVKHILSWPEPKSATEAHGFLGLVHYLVHFFHHSLITQVY
jgi:hypothetical protein